LPRDGPARSCLQHDKGNEYHRHTGSHPSDEGVTGFISTSQAAKLPQQAIGKHNLAKRSPKPVKVEKLNKFVARTTKAMQRPTFHTPSGQGSPWIAASALFETDRVDEASEHIQAILDYNPDFKLRHFQERYPYRDHTQLDRISKALIAAGLT
jgi:hypothetical protein